MKLSDFPEIIFATSKSSDGNMSIYCGDNKSATANKNTFLKKLKIDPRTVSELKQIHSNKVITLNKTTNKNYTADGLVTDKRNIYLIIKTADCLPIAIYDPKNQVISLIHAGWKGLDGKIISKTISKMRIKFNTDPKDLIVYIGPSIGPCHYRKDLWKQVEDQLVSVGVLQDNIENAKLCTYENKEYFSHRRAEDQKLPNDYRFATILGIKK